jgi:hypothetical protein
VSPKGAGLAHLRKLVFDGRLEEAEAALRERLDQVPGDTESQMLLADCLKKMQRWDEAVAQYGQVIESAGPRTASRARFVAAVVLQDRLGDHAQAADLLERYLEQETGQRPLRAEAMLRLARARLARGQQEQAVELLKTVISQHQGTTIAIRARKLLDQVQ